MIAVLLTSPAVAAVGPTRSSTIGSSPRIVLSHPHVQVDHQVRVSVSGLAPGTRVAVRLTIGRGDGTLASQASFVADEHGRVRLWAQSPIAGDYTGTDAMGLFLAARHVSLSVPPNLEYWAERDELTADVDGATVASATLIRRYLRRSGRATAVREDGLIGTLFEPGDHGRHPALLVVGGSEGGKAYPEVQAALLASHGYAALALAYFDPTGMLAGLPTSLSLIPLEYFATALEWLGEQRYVDADRLGIVGGSKGAELALLLASRHPELKAVVAYAPTSAVWGGIPQIAESSWSDHGQPVPFLIPQIVLNTSPLGWYRNALAAAGPTSPAIIPVERANGPILTLSGDDDQLWPSSEMADQVLARLHTNGHAYPDQHLDYPGVGHTIPIPYFPTADSPPNVPPLGGNPVDTERASLDQWPRVLAFLNTNLRTRR